jgi:hypothetical protein
MGLGCRVCYGWTGGWSEDLVSLHGEYNDMVLFDTDDGYR